MPSNSKPAPETATERIGYLDLLRGVALLGILLANVRQLFLPWSISDLPVALDGAALLSWIDWFVFQVVVDQKFLTLFSLLFGASFALQLQRLGRRNQPVVALYLRRLCLLALFGVAHATLLYPAEVLLPYAFAGLILLCLQRMSADTLIRSGLALWTLTIIWGYQITSLGTVSVQYTALAAIAITLVAILLWPRSWRAALIAWVLIIAIAGVAMTLRAGLPMQDSSLANEFSRSRELISAMQSSDSSRWPSALSIRRQGGFADLIGEHLNLYSFILLYFGILLVWRTLGLFMLGAGLMRMRAIDYWSDLSLCRIHCWIGLSVGVTLSLLAALLTASELVGEFDWRWPSLLHVVAALPLALGLASGVYLLRRQRPNNPLLLRVEAAGRMALSNYIGQSAVMAALAEPWGFDGYGRWGTAHLSALALVVFGLLAVLSHAWLQRFRMGPLEWLWRCGTYWRWLPNRG